MKKNWLLIVLALPLSMLAQNAATQQTKKTPNAVKTAFTQRFPTAQKVKYDREGNGEYEANFKLNGISMSANFTAEGTWRETETEINPTTLPTVVTKAITAKYPSAKIVGAAKIETPDKGTQYEADIKTGMKKQEVLFDEAGNFIK